MTQWSNLKKTLKAIAEGYPIQVLDDRYIIVENPEFEEDNGKNPNLLIDVQELD